MVYATKYAQTHPKVVAVSEKIDHVFGVRAKRAARRRYEKALAQRGTFVTPAPEADAIFALQERHWPRLVNASPMCDAPRHHDLHCPPVVLQSLQEKHCDLTEPKATAKVVGSTLAR